MILNSLEYLESLVIEKFKVTRNDFVIKPCFDVFEVTNNSGGDADILLHESYKVVYFASLYLNSAKINTLMAYLDMTINNDFADRKKVLSRLGAEATNVFNFTDLTLFNRLLAYLVPNLANELVIVKGWRIEFLDR